MHDRHERGQAHSEKRIRRKSNEQTFAIPSPKEQLVAQLVPEKAQAAQTIRICPYEQLYTPIQMSDIILHEKRKNLRALLQQGKSYYFGKRSSILLQMFHRRNIA